MIIDAVVIIAGRKWPKNSSDFKFVIDDGPGKFDPPRFALSNPFYLRKLGLTAEDSHAVNRCS